MIESQKRPLRNLVRLLDAAILVAGMGLAVLAHHVAGEVLSLFRASPPFGIIATYTLFAIPLYMLLSSALGLDRIFERPLTRVGLWTGLIKLHALGFVGLTVLLYVTQIAFSRAITASFIASTFLLMGASRVLLLRWQRYQHALGHQRTRLLVVGEEGPALARFLEEAAASPLPPEIVARVGDLAEVEPLLQEGAVDKVLFFPPYHRPLQAAAALEACETVGVPAEFTLELERPARAVPRVVENYDRLFVSFDVAPKRPDQIAIKHAVDLVAASLLVVLFSPVLLLVALAVLVTMGRPVFFVQERSGLFGRRFRMIKFRTMVRDAEARKAELAGANEMTGPVFKVTGDPRVTRLGRFLRKTSLDELPQLFNVVTGSMSLVGPRPLAFAEQQQIRGWHRRRLSMKPGITGLWQVSGRSDVDFEQWMVLDLRYVDRWSLGLDLLILLRTLPTVLFGRGAR